MLSFYSPGDPRHFWQFPCLSQPLAVSFLLLWRLESFYFNTASVCWTTVGDTLRVLMR